MLHALVALTDNPTTNDVVTAFLAWILSIILVLIVAIFIQLGKVKERLTWLEAKANGKPKDDDDPTRPERRR
jgi:hypothetical protein